MRKLLCLAGLMLLTGCATTLPHALETLRVGMDKDEVLKIAGSPKRTYRQDSEDHWIYTYFKDHEAVLKDVTFRDGRVVRVHKPTALRRNSRSELENAETLEEYEAKARELKREKKNFKPADGGE